MTVQRARTLLIFSPRPSVMGGVAEFADMVVHHLGAVRTERFRTGRIPNGTGTVFRGLVPMYDALRLVGLLMRRRHDIYHLNPSFVPRAIVRDAVFLLLLRLFRRPNVLVFIHGWNSGFYRRVASNKLARLLFRACYGWAAKIMVLAPTFAHDLEKLGIDRQRITITTTMFEGDALREVTRRRTDDEVRVLFLGRFIAAKGIYELLEAFKRARASCPELVLIMAGDGPEMRKASNWCQHHGLAASVRFTGYVEGADKAQLMADADIFVLPSYREGCPVALLEAMAAGLPAIVTPVGGIPEVVRHDVNGLLVRVRDVESLAAALEQLAADRPRREAMARRNREEAWGRFEASKLVATLERHYFEMAQMGSTPAADNYKASAQPRVGTD